MTRRNDDLRRAQGIVSFYLGLREAGGTDPAESGELAEAIARALAAARAVGYREAADDSRAVCSRAGGCLP